MKDDEPKRSGPRAARTVQERLAQVQARNALLEAALDRLTFGVILSERTGRVWFCNREARRMASAGDAFGVWSKRVVARDRSEDEQLTRLVRRAALPAADGQSSAGAMMLSRREAGPGLQVVVCPISTTRGGGDRAIGIFIADATTTRAIDSDVIRTLLGLTSTEARVAAAYCDGLTPTEIGDRAGLTKETVRWYLKQVYSKAGVNGQRELARRLHGIPPVWPTD